MKIEFSNNGKWEQSLTIKMFLLAVIGLFLLVPLEMIKSIISERQKNSEDVKKQISSQWAGPQSISGPILNIPMWNYPSKKDADPYKSVFHILPETLLIKGNIQTEERHKSIYKVVVYSSRIDISGKFIIPEIKTAERTEILWNEAYYSLGISDNRGIKGMVSLKTDSETIEAVPGLKETELSSSGITFPEELNENNRKIQFSLTMELSGSEGLRIVPTGKTTDVILSSTWNSPGFTGSFLPVNRNIRDSGFEAKWQVTNLNRNFPQYWIGNLYKPADDSFGVDFILQADHYQKSIRSAKYGILFIALTFLTLLFVELSMSEKIHIFHYLLLALGLVLFFSLLNALSEQMEFNFAYLISAASTISLITIFLKAVLIKMRPVVMVGGILVFLYAFIFVLLTLKDYAYLVGNIGLFIILATTMRASLKLNFNKRDF